MDFEYESPSSSSPSYSSPSPSQLTPCTPPNHNPSDSSQPQLRASHKRKAGRKKFRETRHPVYRGVRQRNGNKWVCEVREPNKKSRIWLGTYPTPEMAARAYDVAVLALRGSSAAFNFPESALLLPVVGSSSATDIRAAAAKAAEAFRPSTPSSFLSSSHNNFCGETVCKNGDTNPFLVEEESHQTNNVVKSSGTEEEEKRNNDESKSTFFDEEALYNMPGLLDSMAEGLLITPPSMKRAMDWDDIGCDDIGCELIELTLWRD